MSATASVSQRIGWSAAGNGRGQDGAAKFAIVSIEKQGIVRVAATADHITATDFGSDGVNPLASLLGASWSGTRVVLDFSRVAYIDSSAIGWLIQSQRAFKDAGGTLIVHSVQPGVRQILDVLKIAKVVSIVDDENAAKALLSVPSGKSAAGGKS